MISHVYDGLPNSLIFASFICSHLGYLNSLLFASNVLLSILYFDVSNLLVISIIMLHSLLFVLTD